MQQEFEFYMRVNMGAFVDILQDFSHKSMNKENNEKSNTEILRQLATTSMQPKVSYAPILGMVAHP